MDHFATTTQQHFQPDDGLVQIQNILKGDKNLEMIDAELHRVSVMVCSHPDFKPCVESLKISLERKRKHIQKILETRHRLTTQPGAKICDEAIDSLKTTLRLINKSIAADYETVEEVMNE